jgi:hypothetical protein
VAGRTDLLASSAGSVLAMVNSGQSVRAIYQMDSAPQIVVALNPAITDIRQCRSMATSIAGTNVRAMTVQAAQLLKVDWELVQLANAGAFAPTVLSGRADCGMSVYSQFASALAQHKLHVIFDSSDPSKLPPGWPTVGGSMNVLSGLAAHLAARAGDVTKFLKAYDEAVQAYVQTPPQQIAAALVAYKHGWEAVGVDALAGNVGRSTKAMRPDQGRLSDAAWLTTLTYFARGGLDFVKPADPKWSAASLVDMKYYDDGIGKHS